MRPAVLALLLAASALGGCTGGHPAGTVTDAAPSLGTDGSPLPSANASALPPRASDTMHLLSAPLAAFNGTGNATIALPKGSTPQTFLWNTTLRHGANLTDAQASIWVRFTGTQMQTGNNHDPGCTLSLLYVLTLNKTARAVDGGCASLGTGILPIGTYRLDLSVPPTGFAPPIRAWPGDDLQVQVSLWTTPLTPDLGPTAYILTGSPGFDSRVRFAGASEEARINA
ncbi:MAG TPA: hypothetical protein VM286_05955 [Candidatus Thermoplasmatota archaeon]|nr:hypothetical protein [Candidatus Thermoplasmatota archaeon]